MIGFSPEVMDGKVHKLEVRLKDPDANGARAEELPGGRHEIVTQLLRMVARLTE